IILNYIYFVDNKLGRGSISKMVWDVKIKLIWLMGSIAETRGMNVGWHSHDGVIVYGNDYVWV
ncbi:MAG: hypothetical protein AAF639_19330, partial [Chloroflexota bacterium]